MNDSFSSEHLEELIAGYVLEDLNSEEAEELERLFAQNPELLKKVSQLQEIMTLIPYEIPEVQPSPELRSKILVAVQNNEKPVGSKKRNLLFWREIIAALVVLSLGIDNYYLRQELRSSQAQLAHQTENIVLLKQPNSRLVSLKGVDTSIASGSIILAPNQQKFLIVLENLSRLPENKIYRLWAIVDGNKIACGQFNTSSTGNVLDSFPIPTQVCSLEKAKLVVTQEPVPSPPQPVGSPVLVGETRDF